MRAFGGLVLLAALARTVVADELPPPPPDPTAPAPPSEADQLFLDGRALLEANEPGQACAKFEASLRLAPESLGTILNLGLCNEQLDRLATALRWFRRAQSRASELSNENTESAAKRETSDLSIRVPTMKITFTHPASRAVVVEIDGAKIEEIDYARVEVDAGRHEVVMTAPDQPRETRTVTIEDGRLETVVLPIKVVEPPPPPKHYVTVDDGQSTRRHAYILGGVGAGLLIADTALGLVGRSKFRDTDELATRDRWQNIVRYGGTSLFLAGGAAIGTAAYLYLRAPHERRIEVAPAVDHAAVGLSVSGRF